MGNQRAVTDLIRTADRLRLDFTRDDYGHPELSALPRELENEIYQHCTADAPPIVCQTFEHAMYLRRHGGRLVPRHLTRGLDDIDHGESDEHKACKERVVRMAEQRGLDAFAESSLTAAGVPAKGRRNDVVIRGSATIGYEAQYSEITPAVVTRRVNLGVRDGVKVYFGAPLESRASTVVTGRAPAGLYNHIPALEIARGRPMPVVSGVRALRRWRCADEPAMCPEFGTRRLCAAQWHSDYGEPRRIEQDDLLYGLAVEQYVPVRLPAKGGAVWQIVPAESIEDYLADGGRLLDAVPASRSGTSGRVSGAAPEENPECRYSALPASPVAVVRFDHGGVSWGIPAELIGLQRAWDAEHAAVQGLAAAGDREALAAARGRRLELTDRLYDHPWLLGAMSEGKRLQADQALKAAARAARGEGGAR